MKKIDKESDKDKINIENSLIESVERSDLKDVTTELAEVGLDTIFEEGIVKEIPIIKTISAIVSVSLSIRDRLFTKKIIRFLSNLDNATLEERKAQIDKIAKNPKERKKLGENLLLLLDKLDNIKKPALLARAFQGYLDKRITRAQFQSIARVIDAIIPEYINIFKSGYEKKIYEKITEPNEETSHFQQCGLLSMKFEIFDHTTSFGNAYPAPPTPTGHLQINNLGNLFYEIVLKSKLSESK